MKQQMAKCSWAAVQPVLPRAALVLVSMVTACLMGAQLWAQWSSTHAFDAGSYKLRGAFRVNVHTDCCGAEEKWKELAAAKRIMPKDSTYQNMTAQQLREELPVRVISLARAADRRTTVTKVLDAAGVAYELVDAVDAANASIPLEDVKKYVRGVRLKFWEKGYKFQRQKVAVDLSHYRNLERIAKESRTAVILEDDAVIADATTDKDAWYKAVLTALRELPQDWDVLFLDICMEKRGTAVGEHVKIARQSLCTLGYVATPRFAHKVLSEVRRANMHLRTPVVDLLYCDLIEHWEVAGYVAVPPLAYFSGVKSTMNYEEGLSNLTAWDLWWTGRRRLHAGIHMQLH